MSAASPQTEPMVNVAAESMRFVQQLAADVSKGELELPSYPQVAMQVQRALSDPNSDAEKVAKVLHGDAVLAARVVGMANSAAFGSSVRPISDVRAAVARLGFNHLRTAAIGFAMAQLRRAQSYQDIQKPLADLWQHSLSVASMGYVLARKLGTVRPDAALLAGLVSGVGKLYILTRRSGYPALFADARQSAAVIREWHPQVARSVLESWQLTPDVVEAVAGIEEAPLDDRDELQLSDVLATAQLLVDMAADPQAMQAELASNLSAQRLNLTPAQFAELLSESSTELAAVRASLSG